MINFLEVFQVIWYIDLFISIGSTNHIAHCNFNFLFHTYVHLLLFEVNHIMPTITTLITMSKNHDPQRNTVQ
jgi:hypothetical protein